MDWCLYTVHIYVCCSMNYIQYVCTYVRSIAILFQQLYFSVFAADFYSKGVQKQCDTERYQISLCATSRHAPWLLHPNARVCPFCAQEITLYRPLLLPNRWVSAPDNHRSVLWHCFHAGLPCGGPVHLELCASGPTV